MGKTNDYRACELVAVWRYKHGAMVVDGVLDDLRNEVTQALDRAEKRGRRKAAEVFAENTALKAQIACFKYAPRDVDDAARLAMTLVNAAYGVALHNDEEADDELEQARQDVIDAIGGDVKQPAPQFDAEKVRGLIELYAHNRWQEGRQFGPNDNSVMSCDDFHNRAEYYGRRLLTALGVEDLS